MTRRPAFPPDPDAPDSPEDAAGEVRPGMGETPPSAEPEAREGGEWEAEPDEGDLEPDAAEAGERARARALPVPAGPARGLGPSDPLARYIWEINRHPLLSREEEHELAVRYHEQGDLDAAYRLVTANLRLVVKIANDYRRAAFNLLDLIQEGNVGLMLAVKKFDPYKGVKLSTYAAWWIRAYIIRYVMENWRMVKLGTTQAQRKLFFNLRKEKRKLEALGFNPEPKLLAERLDVSEQDVVDMDQRLSAREASLDVPVGEEGGATLGERLTLQGEGADQVLADRELREIFSQQLRAFETTLRDDRERFIFERRLLAEEPLTLQEVGAEFGVTRERARQLEKRIVNRLRDHMAREVPDFGELVIQERD